MVKITNKEQSNFSYHESHLRKVTGFQSSFTLCGNYVELIRTQSKFTR